MPWCDGCDRYYTPPSVRPDGTCPHCGRALARPGGGGADRPPVATRAPWHFWLMVAAVAVYLGWRLVQGLAWMVDHL
ncbi:MAG TPA: hypothetical protein VGB14_04930 [Acidimicrobiales bacterium]|jgi:hypothetical protein